MVKTEKRAYKVNNNNHFI